MVNSEAANEIKRNDSNKYRKYSQSMWFLTKWSKYESFL